MRSNLPVNLAFLNFSAANQHINAKSQSVTATLSYPAK